jgi:subtilase family serine protease
MAMTSISPALDRRRPRRSAIVAALAITLSAILGGSTWRTVAPAVGPVRATAPVAIPAGSSDLGATDPATPIRFSLVLHQPGGAALGPFLAGLHDPGSADYHRYIDAATYGHRFGLSDADMHAVETWLRSAGLTVVQAFPQRTTMVVSGPAGIVDAAFKTGLVNAVDAPSGSVYHRPSRQPTIPAAIAGLVDGVADLENRPPRMASGGGRAVTGGSLRPTDLAAAYDIGPMYANGLRGDGVYVAIVAFCAHLASDIAAYEGQYDIEDPPHGNAVTAVPVGPVPICHDDQNQAEYAEPSGDIEVVRAVAPHANILNFESTYSNSQSDVINAIVADGRASIVTDSYGRCYDDVPVVDRVAGLVALGAAYAKGINVLVASGDWGAYDCYNSDTSEQQLSVDWPSSTAFTISVGGTNLNVRTDGAYYDEAPWQDYLSVLGSGGGLNPIEPRPAWQHGPGVDNAFSNGKRQVPDVAASAAIASGYSVWYTSPYATDTTHATPHSIGGTSMASPFWAGVMALLEQHVAATPGIKWPKNVLPMLYDIAADPSNGAFHDIVRGNNLYYDATPGWDYATGLGSPDVAKLDAAIIAYLRR